jgi:hypothetical protein
MVAAKRAAALFVLAIGAGPDPIHVAAEADGEGAVVSPAARLSGRATSGCRWAPSFPVESATSCRAVALMHHFLTLLDTLFRYAPVTTSAPRIFEESSLRCSLVR